MDFIGKSRLWFFISTCLLIMAAAALISNSVVRGKAMNFGIDFTGGTMLTLRFEKPVGIKDIRELLTKHNLSEGSIQKIGENDISIRTEPIDNEVRIKLLDDFKQTFGNVELLEADIVGPVVGKELTGLAIWALIWASIGIIIYVSFRFEFRYAVTALLALYHDAIITTGIIALLWRSVDTPFIAAILTIMGYSINDTIVIFDRIRENLKKQATAKLSFPVLVNTSLNETLARSMNTVLTTLFMAFALYIFGGATIKDFCLILLFGFTIGAYSSIFVAPPLLVLWDKIEKAQIRK